MRTTQTKIRPRLRVAEPAPQHSACAGISEPVGHPATAEDAMPPLRLLARLPEVALPPDQAKLSLRLDWLKRLDWQQVRRIKLDPNWVAGGVLSLVLLLLLIITFNRSSKPAVESPSTDEAPAWNTAGKTPPSSVSPKPGFGAPINASTVAPNERSPVNAGPYVTDDTDSNHTPGGNNVPFASDSSVRRLAAETSEPATTSLEGIYYPRTRFEAVAAQPVIANQTAGQPIYGSEIRTAQRDVIAPYHPPSHSAPPQSGQAHFEGIIQRP
ncbi:MAG: hypothetical protein WD894_04915 [Pirellulales bacterium]